MVKERKKGKPSKSMVFKKKDGTGGSFKARFTRSKHRPESNKLKSSDRGGGGYNVKERRSYSDDEEWDSRCDE